MGLVCRDEPRSKRGVSVALDVLSCIPKLRPANNPGDKTRVWGIRVQERIKTNLDGETNRDGRVQAGNENLPSEHEPSGKYKGAAKLPHILEVSEGAPGRIVEVDGSRPPA